ncbi:hypothetical protein FDECE_8514 [Fusarium decemcellulare]|nr:hypothetical protein FDECE_8514 [Fusarium decemcellulare]
MLVLVYGITGMVGQPTARAALAAGHQIRDAYDIPAYDEAVAGVDAIISAPSGAFETALDGQILLLRAAERAGIKIFHASSWNYDWTRLPLGFHEGYDPLLSFWNHACLSSTINPIATFTGTIPDYVFYSSTLNNPFNTKALTFSCFGTGHEIDIFTTADDIAAYAIAAISEPTAADGGIRYVESFRASMLQPADAYEDVHSVQLKRKNLGDVDEVDRRLKEGRATTHPSNYNDYSCYIYLQIQLKGLCLHDIVDSKRWSHIKQTGLKEWLKAHPNI